MSDDRDDLNTVSFTGVVWGEPLVSNTSEGCVMSFMLTVSKVLRGTGALKLSNFKVVLFDDKAIKHEDDIFDGQTILVQGELDQCCYFKGGQTHREVRIVARFVKILGNI